MRKARSHKFYNQATYCLFATQQVDAYQRGEPVCITVFGKRYDVQKNADGFMRFQEIEGGEP